MVATELLALAGELDDERLTALRARRLPPVETASPSLDRATLAGRVFPPEGAHVLVEVARIIAGTEGKVLRTDVAELGLTPRDRIGSRSGNALRALLDRLLRQVGIEDVELAASPKADRTRIVAQDDPWVVVPASLSAAPDGRQAASLGRAVARLALGVPWLGELPLAHARALLVGAARTAVPAYASADPDPPDAALTGQLGALVAKAVSRKQRRQLEELVPRLSARQPPLPFADLLGSLMRAELRTAFLLTGDLLSLLDDLATADAALQGALASPGPAALGGVLRHPIAADLVRFALTPEATALRKRAGAVWTRP
jgi:hypothetical protein